VAEECPEVHEVGYNGEEDRVIEVRSHRRQFSVFSSTNFDFILSNSK